MEGEPMLAFVQPQKQCSLTEKVDRARQQYLCALCKTYLTQTQFLCVVQSNTPYHTFTNPNGILFDILTVSFCQRIFSNSVPTLEHTWFSGYAWSVLCCQICQQHLGWQYDATIQASLNLFYGLILDRIEKVEEEHH